MSALKSGGLSSLVEKSSVVEYEPAAEMALRRAPCGKGSECQSLIVRFSIDEEAKGETEIPRESREGESRVGESRVGRLREQGGREGGKRRKGSRQREGEGGKGAAVRYRRRGREEGKAVARGCVPSASGWLPLRPGRLRVWMCPQRSVLQHHDSSRKPREGQPEESQQSVLSNSPPRPPASDIRTLVLS